MKTAYFWIIFLVLVGIVASLYLIPTTDELAIIHLKSRRFSAAQNFYLDQYNQGVRTPAVVYELSVLYEKEGDLDDAIKIFQEYTAAHPDDADAFKRLAELYYLNNQYDEYGNTLAKMAALKTKLDPDTLRALKGYYQEKNEKQQQEAVLNTIIKSGKGNEDDYAELAGIYAQEKKFDKAAEILKTRRTYFVEHNTIDMILFELWIDTHLGKIQSEEAVKMVADYLKKKNDPKITFYVLNLFKESYPNLALQLVSLVQPLIGDHTNLELAVLLILKDHPEQKEKVEQEISKLQAITKKNPMLQNFLFDIYMSEEDDEQLLNLIHTTPPQQIEERELIDLATLATIKDKPELVQEVQEALGPEYLQEHPLRALALEIGAQEEDAHKKLDDYLETRSMTRTDRFFLFRLAAAAKFTKEALEIGNSFPPFVAMQEDELLDIAEAYVGMKKADLLYPMIEKSIPTIGEKNAGPALTLLNIALKHPQAAKEWMQAQIKIKEGALKVFFETAKDVKEYPLAFDIAQRLYEHYPSASSESDYGLALVQIGKITEGMPLLKQLYADHPLNSQIQRDYLAALIVAVKQDKQYTHDLVAYMDTREKQGHLPKELLRNFGYIYIETLHNFSKAKNTFFALANEPHPNHQDIETLIYLWGPRVSEEHARWIEGQAHSSEDIAYWLENLNFIGRFQSTIHVFQERAPKDIKAYFAYMQALANEKWMDELKRTIYVLFPKLTNRKQLEELATYAEVAEYNEARVWVWQKIASEFPYDPKAWQALGRALFDMRSNTVAREALENFFDLDQGTNSKYYESLYEYAEILRKQRYFSLSREYYVAALDTIAMAEEQTLRMTEIAAQSYYQLNRNSYYKLNTDREALFEIDEFFTLSGKDADSTAAYANLLMDTGRLKQAQQLLMKRR